MESLNKLLPLKVIISIDNFREKISWKRDRKNYYCLIKWFLQKYFSWFGGLTKNSL